MVTGEGGMFCTDDSELYRKAQYLNDYAVDTDRFFHVDKLGFKYRMSNLQAALGIAQLRRIETLWKGNGKFLIGIGSAWKTYPKLPLTSRSPVRATRFG